MNENAQDKSTKVEVAGETSSPSSFILHPSSLLLVLLLLVGARLWHLTASCLWFDEVFSVHAARHGWAGMVRFVAADVIHPPFFYALLKVWITAGGESLLWLRLFPVLLGVAAALPFLLLCRELRLNAAETRLALLLVAVNGYLIKYAQELRMYSLLFFLTLCSLWLFIKFIRAVETNGKWLLALTLINLLLVYTHYYGWVLVMTEALALLAWKRSRLTAFLLSVAFLVLAYCPWVYALAAYAEPGGGLGQNIGWVARPGPSNLAQYFVLLNKPFDFAQSSAEATYGLWSAALTLVLFAIPLGLLFRQMVMGAREKTEGEGRSETLRLLFFFAFVPALLVFLLSLVLPYSVWGTRHLIIAAGPYSILAALALSNLRPYWVKVSALLLLGSWLFLAAAYVIFRPVPAYIWCAWEPLARQMAAAESASAAGSASTAEVRVYAYEDLVAYHLWFALDTPSGSRFKVVAIKGVPGIEEDTAYFLPRDFKGVLVLNNTPPEGERVWAAFRAASWDESRPPLDSIKAAGYRIGRVLSAPAQGQQAFMVELLRNKE